jgi:osmotically-inducible protein OsmY
MRQLPRLNDDPTQLLAQALPDEELVHRARSLLRWKCRFDSVQVAAQAGRVTLSGDVMFPLDREIAEHTIRKLSGVIEITNLITTRVGTSNRSSGSRLR